MLTRQLHLNEIRFHFNYTLEVHFSYLSFLIPTLQLSSNTLKCVQLRAVHGAESYEPAQSCARPPPDKALCACVLDGSKLSCTSGMANIMQIVLVWILRRHKSYCIQNPQIVLLRSTFCIREATCSQGETGLNTVLMQLLSKCDADGSIFHHHFLCYQFLLSQKCTVRHWHHWECSDLSLWDDRTTCK